MIYLKYSVTERCTMAARRRARRQAKREQAGMGQGMSSKAMRKAMNQMNVEDLKGVEEVIIRMKDKEIVLTDSEVQSMHMQGQEIYTITVGKSTVRKRQGEQPNEEVKQDIEVNENDIKLVMEQSKCDYDTAKQALIDSGGDLASAIMKVVS